MYFRVNCDGEASTLVHFFVYVIVNIYRTIAKNFRDITKLFSD